MEKIVPLNRIQDIVLQSTGGGCIEGRYPMDTVEVQTAGSGAPQAEIVVKAIKSARLFKQNVLNVKNGNSVGSDPQDNQVTSYVMSTKEDGKLVEVMTEIRDLIKQQNQYLKLISEK